MHPRLIILCGLPGSGKTTLARRMEQAWPVVRFGADEWMADLGVDLYNEVTRDRLERRFTRLTLDLLRLGQSVVLEFGFWVRAERDQKRAEAHAVGVPIDLYYLNPLLEELWRRLQARNEGGEHGTVPISRENLEYWATLFQAPDAAEFALFDTAVEVADACQYPIA